jgi:hypothetical protein
MHDSTRLELVFSALLIVQFVVVVSHDLLDIPGLTNGSQVRAVIGRRKLWLATAINAIFPGVAAALAVLFWNSRKPTMVAGYWLIYCAITLLSAIVMWYVPYLFGTRNEKLKSDYAQMYAGTRQILPPRGDNPRPNLLHVCFHLLFFLNVMLASMIWVRRI